MYFKGRRVSGSVYTILMEAERRLASRGGVPLNSRKRTRADQERLIREQGVYNSVTNPHGAALYSPNAPHVWEGREEPRVRHRHVRRRRHLGGPGDDR